MAKQSSKSGVASTKERQDSPSLTLSDSPVFRVRLSPGRSQTAPKVRGFIGRIKALVRQHGASASNRRYRAQGGLGGSAAARLPVRLHPQRVVIKARVVRHSKFAGAKGGAGGALRKHIDYLGRAGVAEDEGRGVAFNNNEELTPTKLSDFRDEIIDDRHHFRFIVSPEHGERLDLRSLARELVSEMQKDLGTNLQWIGVAHYDTDDPHIHLLLRGKDERGEDLVISRNYLSHGMRLQAMELATRHLGPRLQEDLERSRQRELKADRLTPKDWDIAAQGALRPDGLVSALRRKDGALGSETERLRTLARLAHLESLSLAREISPGIWQPHPDLVAKLRALSIRGDIIKTMHERMRGMDAAMRMTVLTAETPAREPIIGRVHSQGTSDELTDDPYLVVEATDGVTYHVNLSSVRQPGDFQSPVGSVVRISPSAARTQGKSMQIESVSQADLNAQVNQNGVTWLDRAMAAGAHLKGALRMGASRFQGQLQEAMTARLQHLKSLGLTEAGEGNIRLKNGFLDELYARELSDAHQRLQPRYGEFVPLQPDQELSGHLAGIEHLPSGPHALIEAQDRYALLPAHSSLMRQVGKDLRISIGRARGLDSVRPAHEQWALRYRVFDRDRSIKRRL
jgi:type IV secretory pathway VirD2 relaxase